MRVTLLGSGAMPTPPKFVSIIPRAVMVRLLPLAGFVRFAVVGALTFILTTGLYFTLEATVLQTKPVTAFTLVTMVATVVSYVLNREWSFAERRGRVAHHEAFLFFGISSVAVGINQIPLAVSRYVIHLQVPYVQPLTEHVADFVSGSLVGTMVAMAFRWWAFRKWVFPELQGAVGDSTSSAEFQDGTVEPSASSS